MSLSVAVQRSVLVLVFLVVIACSGVQPQRTSAPASNTPATLAGGTAESKEPPKPRTIVVRYPARAKAGDSAEEQKFEERTFEVMRSTRDVVIPLRRPPGLERKAPWRPLRYFGPFHAGSDIRQIQIRLHGASAEWFYNDYFASFDPTDTVAQNVFREYHRPRIGDNTSQSTPPTNRPGMLPSQGQAGARQAGFAHNVLFALQEVAYSGRYGGSVRFRFELADVPMPSRAGPEPENFDYEFGRDSAGVGSPRWLFDTNTISMLIYVKPALNLINPKQSHDFSVDTFVEFEPREFVAYRDGVAQPAGTGRDELDAVLAVTAGRIPTELDSRPTQNRPYHSVFTHAWIHNQHFTLIGFDDKVTHLYIADGWADPVTEAYRPVIFVSFRFLSLRDAEDDLLWSLEHDEEWKLRLRVFRESSGGSAQIRDKTWNVDEAYSPTSYTSIVVTDPGDDCGDNQDLKLRVRLIDVDPLNPDDRYKANDRFISLDCDLFEQLTGTGWQQHFTVYGGVLPTEEDTSLNSCGTPPPIGTLGEPLFCLGPDGTLIGRSDFTRPSEPSSNSTGSPELNFPIAVARGEWEVKAAILAR